MIYLRLFFSLLGSLCSRIDHALCKSDPVKGTSASAVTACHHPLLDARCILDSVKILDSAVQLSPQCATVWLVHCTGTSVKSTGYSAPNVNKQLEMKENSKRKAKSPCENLAKSKSRIVDSSTDSFKSAASFDSPISPKMNNKNTMETSAQMSDHFNIRVTKKDGEPFVGGFDRSQCFEIWQHLDLYPNDLLYGISLIQVPDRPFMANFQLNELADVDMIPSVIKCKIGGSEYEMSPVLPRAPPPNLGENFIITIKDTRFKITLKQADTILGLFGVVTTKSIHVDADDVKQVKIKTDDVRCVVKLRKHIPSFLPGYGRKLQIRYYGQPLQCSKCLNPGHLRKKCPNEPIEWLRYVKLLVDEKAMKLEHIGDWAKSIDWE